jgi:RNA polymerase-interacting CarD/CdnL/TRCF family regulator
MSTSQDTFSKGDWIVHAHYGIGQIKGKETKVLEQEKQAFYRVKTFNGVYWLPVENVDVDHIRPVASKRQIKRALTLIRKPPDELPDNHRSRKKEISQVFKDLSLYSKARMIRDLHGKRVSSRLNFSEGDAYEKMKKQFLNEWSVIRSEDRATLEKKLQQALMTSIEKSTNGNGAD